MILILFLVPFTMTNNNSKNVCINIQTRIRELEEIQFQKEREISELNEMITEKMNVFDCYKSNALDYLKSENDVALKENSSLDQLIENFKTEFDNTKNITQMFKEGLKDSHEMVRIALLRVILEERFIEKLIVKFEACVQELIEINIELIDLKRTML